MRPWISRLTASVFLCFSAGRVRAAETDGFSFLDAPPEASAAAMAGAVAARREDPSALSCNPAGLADLREESVSLHSRLAWQDVTQEAVSYARPSPGGGWGVVGGLMNVGGLVKTRYDPSSPDRFVTDGSLRAGDQYAGAAVGRRLNWGLSWGAGAKILKEDLDTRSAAALALDAGLLRRLDSQWALGAALQNVGVPVWFSSASVAPPARVQAGVFYSPEDWAEWELDDVQPFQGSGELLLGGQFRLEQTTFLRVGYRFLFRKNRLGAMSGASAGLGARLDGLGIDYALEPFGDLGMLHRVTLSWRWGSSMSSAMN